MTRRTYRRRRGGDPADDLDALAAFGERKLREEREAKTEALREANYDAEKARRAAAREKMMAEARAQAPTADRKKIDPVKAALWGRAKGSALSQVEQFVKDRGSRRSAIPRPEGESLVVREKRFRDFAFCAQHGHRKMGAAAKECRKSGKLTAATGNQQDVYIPAYYETNPNQLDAQPRWWNTAWLPFAGRGPSQGAPFEDLTLEQSQRAGVTPYATKEAEKRGLAPLVGGRKSRRRGRKYRRGGRKSTRVGGRKYRRARGRKTRR